MKQRARCGCHYGKLIEGLEGEVCRDQATRDQGRKRELVSRECWMEGSRKKKRGIRLGCFIPRQASQRSPQVCATVKERQSICKCKWRPCRSLRQGCLALLVLIRRSVEYYCSVMLVAFLQKLTSSLYRRGNCDFFFTNPCSPLSCNQNRLPTLKWICRKAWLGLNEAVVGSKASRKDGGSQLQNEERKDMGRTKESKILQ